MVVKRVGIGIALGCAVMGAVLFLPPVRDRFFTTKLWPWRTRWDTTLDEIEQLRALAEPGDVIVESNMHGWQWMALCLATTGTTWVHAALVDNDKRLITVHKEAIEADWNIYLDWGSTRLALLRPPYRNREQAQAAIDCARGKLGTCYDPSFRDHAGNCNGLVASSLAHAGIAVNARRCFGRRIYSPDCFFKMPGVKVIWRSDRDRQPQDHLLSFG